MKNLVIGLLAIQIFSTVAIAQDCRDRLEKSLQSDSEKFLFQNYPTLIEQFIPRCDISDSIDYGLIYGIIFIHESTHYEDLGIGNPDRAGRFNLFTVNNEHLGDFSNIESFPRVDVTVKQPLSEDYQSLIQEEDNFFMETHSGYILDNESAAATDIRGLATELNGYTHGLMYENNIKKLLPNPEAIASSQIEGVYYFIFMFNLYLDQLKKNQTKEWDQFLNENNKLLLTKLFSSSIETLRKINHCVVAEEQEYPSQWLKLIKGVKISSAMEEFIEQEKLLELKCKTP